MQHLINHTSFMLAYYITFH